MLISDNTNPGNVPFDRSYTINLHRLQLLNTDYSITTSFSSIHFTFSGSNHINLNWYLWGSATSSNFLIRIYFIDHLLLSHAKFNYLAVSRRLLAPYDFVYAHITTAYETNPPPACDGRVAKKTCTFLQNLNFNASGYRLFSHIVTFVASFSRIPPQISFYNYKLEPINMTKILITYTVEYMHIEYVSCDLTLIKESFFDRTTRKYLMISEIQFTDEVNSGTSRSFIHPIGHFLYGRNLFIAITGYRGN